MDELCDRMAEKCERIPLLKTEDDMEKNQEIWTIKFQ